MFLPSMRSNLVGASRPGELKETCYSAKYRTKP